MGDFPGGAAYSLSYPLWGLSASASLDVSSYQKASDCQEDSRLDYWILKALDAPNDGLVTVESARWTGFRGVVTNSYMRGISHGDMIDLTREDYRGFDVMEFYVHLVEELKEKGF